jgi:uncharacterized protein DUF4932
MAGFPKSNFIKILQSLLLIAVSSYLSRCSSPSSAEQENEIPILISPQVELFSTIHRLAGTGQYDEHMLPEYTREVEKRFAPFRDHHAVHLAIKMRASHGLNGNAPMAMASYLTEPPSLEGRAPLLPPPVDLDIRWTEDAIPMALKAAREFARDSDFMAFFKDQQPFYKAAVGNLRSTLQGSRLLPWFRNFFGYQAENYVIIIGLQNGSCNYGHSVTLPDGTREFVSILGARDPGSDGAPRYPEGWFIPIIVHEFCHSYVNPIVDRNREMLREAGQAVFPYLKERMHDHGYNLWNVMINEFLVRGCTIRYLAAEKGGHSARRQIERDSEAGFPGMRKLVALLVEYEDHRDIYPDLETFMPRIGEYFEEMAVSLRR